MSTIEERLVRDIEAVTGGIDVTDSDLREARKKLDDRIGDSRTPRGRQIGLAVAAAAVVVAGLAGWQALRGDDATPSPAPPGPTQSPLSPSDKVFLTGGAPTPEILEGVWRLDNPTTSRMLVMFTADGGIRYDDTGRLSEDPVVDGAYSIEGDVITVQIAGGLAECEGQTLALRTAVTADGRLNIVPVDTADACGRPDRHQWVLEQLLPTPDGIASLKAPLGASWDPPTGRVAVVGDWLISGGGYVLELRDEGNYSMLAGHGEVVERGTWSVDDSFTRLTMTSSADSQTCREGDQLVQADLRSRNLGAWVLRGTAERDDCAMGFADKPWFRMAP